MQPVVTPYFHAATHTWSYLVACPASATAAIVDPVLDYDAAAARTATLTADALLAHLNDRKLTLAFVLETHAHADHLSAAGYLCRQTGALLGIGAGIAQVDRHAASLFGAELGLGAFDRRFAAGERFALGALEVEVIATPGHTPDGVTYRIGDTAFVGDTLFPPDVGSARCDFPGGDAATLYRSIARILALPDATTLYHCHDYPPAGRAPRATSTVAEQRAANVHVAGKDEAAYVALREARDRTLPVPALLLPALQWNLAGGRAPTPAPNGISYLRLPLDRWGRPA